MSAIFPIHEDPRYRRYTASAGQTVFNIPFPFQQDEDVTILLQIALGQYVEFAETDYTIDGAGDPAGGAVTMNTPRAGGDVILVLGEAVIDRISSVVTNGRFRSELTDGELDRSRILQQEVARENNRAVKVDYGATAYTITRDLEDGDTLMKSGDLLVKGPNAADIENAGPNAAAAAESAALAGRYAVNGDLDVVPGKKAAEYYARKAQEAAGSGIAGVSSFHGRVGAVDPASGDYTSAQITRTGGTVEDALTALFSKVVDPWLCRAVGEVVFVDTSNNGVQVPPASSTDYVWIELTAGLTGVGGFNNGKLTAETITGSGATLSAVATIAVSGSPMNGDVIDLLNTEGRIPRPSTSPGAKQDDALQNIIGYWRSQYGPRTSGAVASGAFYFDTGNQVSGQYDYAVSGTMQALTFDASRVARTSTETRMKNVGVKAYMRVK